MTPLQVARFWSKVRVLKNSDCWEWQGAIISSGYGCFWIGKSSYVTHRIAAFLFGMIPELSAPKNTDAKGFVLHKCDNRKCCNPHHFFIGSFSDNQLDSYNKNRAQPKGQYHTNAKLTNQQAADVRNAYKLGALQKELASRYEVSQRAISLIVRNETYIQC